MQLNLLMTSIDETQALHEYREQHEQLFQDTIICKFFEDPDHASLLGKYLLYHSNEYRVQLESEFNRFFFYIRFTKYLCSLIRYCDIDFHRSEEKKVSEICLFLIQRRIMKGI